MFEESAVLLDGEGAHDGPDPSDEEPAGKDLDDTDDDGGLLLLVVLGENASDDGGPAGGEDGEDEHAARGPGLAARGAVWPVWSAWWVWWA